VIPETYSLLDSMGQSAAGYDFEANRARTDYANRLKKLAAMGIDSRRSLSDTLASQQITHSSAGLEGHTNINRSIDEARAEAGQGLATRLADIARSKISNENAFNIQSMLPR
jgi:hypothetical protein